MGISKCDEENDKKFGGTKLFDRQNREHVLYIIQAINKKYAKGTTDPWQSLNLIELFKPINVGQTSACSNKTM